MIYNRHSDNYRKLFEDFFDDIETEDIIKDDLEDIDSEDIDGWKQFRINLSFANTKTMLELKNCNIAKIFKKIELILNNNILFKTIKCYKVCFYDNENHGLDQQFDIRNLPSNLDNIYNTYVSNNIIFCDMGLVFYFKYVSGNKVRFEKFCGEIYKLMRLIGDNSIYHPESKGTFIFNVNDYYNQEISFGFFNLPIQKKLEMLYNDFYDETVSDDDNSSIHSFIKNKTNLEKYVRHGLETLDKKEEMFFQLDSIVDCDTDNMKLVKIKLVKNPVKTMNVMEIYNNLKLYVFDSIPTHYFMVIRVCLVIYYPDNYIIKGLDSKQLNRDLIVHPKNILKSAEILPVRLYHKDDRSPITRGRFVNVFYIRTSSAVAYMCIPTKKGTVAPPMCYSNNFAVNKILETEFI